MKMFSAEYAGKLTVTPQNGRVMQSGIFQQGILQEALQKKNTKMKKV